MSDSELLRARVIEGSLPQFVCKFRSIGDRASDNNIFKLVENSSLWFDSALSFNDPFDCQIKITCESTIEEKIQWLKKIQKSPGVHSDKELEDEALRLHNEKEEIPRIFNELIQDNGVCCFSKNYDNILQWSHYADSHKGVCLVFDILEDPNFFNELYKVRYKEKYEEFNVVKDFNLFVFNVLLPKSNLWKYEDEVRAFNSHKGLIKFNKSSLKKVIFGCRINEVDKNDLIKKIKSTNYGKIEFIQAKKSESQYLLEFEEI